MGTYITRQCNNLIQVDTQPQVIAVEIADMPLNDIGDFSDDELSDYDGGSLPTVEIPPSATLPNTESLGDCVPLMVFAQKAKLFNDWLYATLDLRVFSGDCPVMGKRALVTQLRSQLDAEANERSFSARALLHVAGQLAGEKPADGLPPGVRLRIKKLLKSFEVESIRSRPIGFYSESDELSRLFRHDRMLQSKLEPSAADELLEGLKAADIINAYSWHLRLAASLTGAFANPPVTSEDGHPDRCLFPPSCAPETDLIKRLYGNTPIPEGFRLFDEVVDRVKDGRLSLEPGPDDGWYLRQLHALEALLRNDSERLKIGEKYKEALEKLFKGLMGLTRETHIKQLESPLVGACEPELAISPRLRVEPFPKYYQRVADGYQWLQTVLEAQLGNDGMDQEVVDRHGKSTCFTDALEEISALFSGAAHLSMEDLGFGAHDTSSLPKLSRKLARDFCANWREDPDLDIDVRMMVPLYFDEGKNRTRVLVVCGFASKEVNASFVCRPQVHVRNSLGLPSKAHITWESLAYSTMHTVSFECDVREVLDRKALQKLANESPRPTELRNALEAQ